MTLIIDIKTPMIKQFVKDLKKLINYSSKDDVRFYLRSVNVSVNEDNSINFDATDGHRACRFVINESHLRHCSEKINYTIPIDTMKKLVAVSKAEKYKNHISISINNGCISLIIGDTHIKTKCIDCHYPDLSAAIPKEDDLEFIATYNKKFLIELMRSVSEKEEPISAYVKSGNDSKDSANIFKTSDNRMTFAIMPMIK